MIQNEQSVVTKPKRIRKPKVEQSPDHQGLSQIQKDAIVQKLIQKEKAVIAENVVSPEKLKQQIAALQQENKELKSRVSRFVEERSSQREALELDKTAEFAKNNKNIIELKGFCSLISNDSKHCKNASMYYKPITIG
jgi:excinuclease UvrABC helicase subunit UvrB